MCLSACLCCCSAARRPRLLFSFHKFTQTLCVCVCVCETFSRLYAIDPRERLIAIDFERDKCEVIPNKCKRMAGRHILSDDDNRVRETVRFVPTLLTRGSHKECYSERISRLRHRCRFFLMCYFDELRPTDRPTERQSGSQPVLAHSLDAC